jgi:predicted component of type VI protein secretion system
MTLRKLLNLAIGARTNVIATVANSIVNYGAVSLSSGLNVYFMRSAEMQSGIDVMDPETMQVVGKSKKAAEMGIF